MNLRTAAATTLDAASRALLAGDKEAHDRLRDLALRLDHEHAYASERTRGLPKVERRPMPPGATIGWLLHNCPATRARRIAAGLSVPPLDHESEEDVA